MLPQNYSYSTPIHNNFRSGSPVCMGVQRNLKLMNQYTGSQSGSAFSVNNTSFQKTP
jgi:hypothetical protein